MNKRQKRVHSTVIFSSHGIEQTGVGRRPKFQVPFELGNVRNASLSGLRASRCLRYLQALTWLTRYIRVLLMLGSNDYPRRFTGDVDELAKRIFNSLMDVVRYMSQHVEEDGRIYVVLPPPRPCDDDWPLYHLYLRSLDALLRQGQDGTYVYLGFCPLLYDREFKPKAGVLYKKYGKLDIHLSTSGYFVFRRWLSDIFSKGRRKPKSTKRCPKPSRT